MNIPVESMSSVPLQPEQQTTANLPECLNLFTEEAQLDLLVRAGNMAMLSAVHVITSEMVRTISTYAMQTMAPQMIAEMSYTPLSARHGRKTPYTLSEVHKEAQRAAFYEGWEYHDPKALIDEMVAELPESVTMYPSDQKDSIPPTEPSRLELYFMSKIPSLAGAKLSHEKTGALPPDGSIGCLRDKVRTKLFMQGVAEAVEQMDSAQETIEVLDAGTGAIPVMAIYAALSSDKVRCTALELNPESARMAREVVKKFGLQDRITIVETDATKYVPEKPVDLLVSETMHSALTAEPIVQILSNLQPHVKPGGVTLPSEVSVKAAIMTVSEQKSAPAYTKIMTATHPAINPSWQHVVNYVPGQPLDKIAFSFDTTNLPDDTYCMTMTSDVTVGSRRLETSQSLITTPQYVMDRSCYLRTYAVQSGQMNGSSTIAVEYAPGDSVWNAAVRL